MNNSCSLVCSVFVVHIDNVLSYNFRFYFQITERFSTICSKSSRFVTFFDLNKTTKHFGIFVNRPKMSVYFMVDTTLMAFQSLNDTYVDFRKHVFRFYVVYWNKKNPSSLSVSVSLYPSHRKKNPI